MEINAANSKPYIYQQLRALELEKVEQILRNFDVNSNKHVDRIVKKEEKTSKKK